MPHRSSQSGPKRRAGVSIRSDVLVAARKARINLSTTLERTLIERLAERRRWRGDNREAIATYNEHVERHGLFADSVRRF
jgi:antitoxin CcdA